VTIAPALPDRNAVAAYRRMLARTGQAVLFRRVSGQAPNVATTDAVVLAVFRAYQPTAPIGSGAKSGAISEGLREFIVLQADLAEQRFPLPLRKNDRIIPGTMVDDSFVPGTELFNITEVDPGTRIVAGAIAGKAEGV
jgi:hypothetical protein